MKIPDLIPLFDEALLNKNETQLFLIGQKIARKYSYHYFRNYNITCDYELIADDVTINMLKVVKETNWKKEFQYYFGCIKQGTRFRYLNLLKETNTISLDAFTTNEYGENYMDHLQLQPITSERSSEEELILDYVHQAIELADQFLDKKTVEKQLGIDHKLFLFICKKYGIQFYTDKLKLFLYSMRFYNIYCETGHDLQATRRIAKEKNLTGNVKGNIKTAETFLDMWRNKKNVFMNRLIYPPNRTSYWSKF